MQMRSCSSRAAQQHEHIYEGGRGAAGSVSDERHRHMTPVNIQGVVRESGEFNQLTRACEVAFRGKF